MQFIVIFTCLAIPPLPDKKTLHAAPLCLKILELHEKGIKKKSEKANTKNNPLKDG